MNWADGGGAEAAQEMLSALSPNEWSEIKNLCAKREAKWRACLATILCPQQGEIAGRLMLDLAWDPDPEVAFLAVSAIAFYCGVNSSATGPFVDLKIQNASFLSLASATIGLADRVREMSSVCDPLFKREIELFLKTCFSRADAAEMNRAPVHSRTASRSDRGAFYLGRRSVGHHHTGPVEHGIAHADRPMAAGAAHSCPR